MSARPIVVDDFNPLFQYETGWFQDEGSQDNVGNFGPPFRHTLHGTNSNSSFSFSFQGSSIQIMGTTNRVNTSTGFDPSWECFIDKISIGATQPFQYPENNWVLCDQPQLVDGQHVVTVNVSQATQAGRTFWFDDIVYTPSSDVSSDGAYTLVDNVDPAIAYGDGWLNLGDVANFTSQTGTEFVFNFTGIGLSWFGMIPTEFSHSSSSATYSIDGSLPVTFRLNGLPQGGSTAYNQIFFSIPQLPPGTHNLRVIHGGTDAETPLTLDYLLVTMGSNTAISTSTTTSTSTPTSASTPQPSDSHETPVRSIVGGVIGGIIAVILGLLFLLWRRRRRNVQLHDNPKLLQDVSPPMITTYGSSSGPHQHVNSNEISYSTSLSPSTSHLYPISMPVDPSPTSGSTIESSRSTEPLTNAIRKQAKELVRLEYTHMEPVIYQDSGRRFHQNDGAEVPPGYTAD